MILVLLPWSEGTNLSHWSVKKKKKNKKLQIHVYAAT